MSFLNELFHKKKRPSLEDLPPAPQPPQKNTIQDKPIKSQESLADLPPISSQEQSTMISADKKTTANRPDNNSTTQKPLQEDLSGEASKETNQQTNQAAPTTPLEATPFEEKTIKEKADSQKAYVQKSQSTTPLHMQLPENLQGPETNDTYKAQEKETIEAWPDTSLQTKHSQSDNQEENKNLANLKNIGEEKHSKDFEELPSFEGKKPIETNTNSAMKPRQTTTSPQLFQGDIYIEKKKYARIIQESKEALHSFEQAVGKQTNYELEKDPLTKQYTKANVLFAKMQKQCLHTEGILSKED